MIITMRDIRKAKMCSRGGRKFAERHNIDWDDFLKNGIDHEKLEKIDDGMVKNLLEVARGK